MIFSWQYLLNLFRIFKLLWKIWFPFSGCFMWATNSSVFKYTHTRCFEIFDAEMTFLGPTNRPIVTTYSITRMSSIDRRMIACFFGGHGLTIWGVSWVFVWWRIVGRLISRPLFWRHLMYSEYYLTRLDKSGEK